MPARESFPSGAPCWIDLFSSDPDRSEQFYGELFGWTAEHSGPEFGGYVNFLRDGARMAGMMRNDGSSGAPDMWSTYLCTPDAKSTTEAAVAAGGQVHVEPMQVADLGSMGLLADTGGAAIGVWQPGTFTGYQRVAEVGAPAWHELHTRDYAAVLDFYRTVFGWETRVIGDTDEFRYTQLVVDGQEYAGVMDASAFLPEGVPSSWQVYIGVEDTDAAVAKAVELGGSVLQPAEDTPYGRLAAMTDPTGATVRIVDVTS